MTKDLSAIVGRIIVEIDGKVGEEGLQFNFLDGSRIVFTHEQDCCESVTINDITGDLEDLIGSPLLRAEERINEPKDGEIPDSFDATRLDSYTWTFYEFATIKGSVTVRWLGESNGYYSERVDWKIQEAK